MFCTRLTTSIAASWPSTAARAAAAKATTSHIPGKMATETAEMARCCDEDEMAYNKPGT